MTFYGLGIHHRSLALFVHKPEVSRQELFHKQCTRTFLFLSQVVTISSTVFGR